MLYARRVARSKLVGLAETHSLQLEMETERFEALRQRGKKARRGRMIAAPIADEENRQNDIKKVRAKSRRSNFQ